MIPKVENTGSSLKSRDSKSKSRPLLCQNEFSDMIHQKAATSSNMLTLSGEYKSSISRVSTNK